MLSNTGLFAADDGKIVVVCQKHSDHGFLRDELQHSVSDLKIFRRLQKTSRKARAVIVVDPDYTFLHRRITLCRGVNGKVPALAVTTDAQSAIGKCFSDTLKVKNRAFLTRHLIRGRHVEVLLPSDQRIICAFECNKYSTVVHLCGEGGKLLLILIAETIHVSRKLCIVKPAALRHKGNHLPYVFTGNYRAVALLYIVPHVKKGLDSVR